MFQLKNAINFYKDWIEKAKKPYLFQNDSTPMKLANARSHFLIQHFFRFHHPHLFLIFLRFFLPLPLFLFLLLLTPPPPFVPSSTKPLMLRLFPEINLLPYKNSFFLLEGLLRNTRIPFLFLSRYLVQKQFCHRFLFVRPFVLLLYLLIKLHSC